MQGPDAVTFDNLTLAHFLDKADRLAGSAEEIKALNAQVHPFAEVKQHPDMSALLAYAFCIHNWLCCCAQPPASLTSTQTSNVLEHHKHMHLLLDITSWLLLAASRRQLSRFSAQAAYAAMSTGKVM